MSFTHLLNIRQDFINQANFFAPIYVVGKERDLIPILIGRGVEKTGKIIQDHSWYSIFIDDKYIEKVTFDKCLILFCDPDILDMFDDKQDKYFEMVDEIWEESNGFLYYILTKHSNFDIEKIGMPH